MTNFKKISIVVLTYNSQKTLRPCLKAITNLNYPKDFMEVFLLDNGSQDKTTLIIKQCGYNYISLPNLNLSELRNYGADVSAGDIIAYIDSDCVVATDWLTQVIKWFDDPIVGIVGNEYLLPKDATFFERNWYNKSNYGIKYNELIPAGNMAVKKEYFHNVGGFNSDLLTGEDDYILKVFRQAGYTTISDHRICSMHLGNAKNLREYFKKETWYGLGMLGTVHLSKLDKPLLATIIFSLSCFTFFVFLIVYFWNEKANNLIFAGSALLCALIIPLVSTIDRVYRKKRKGNFFFVTIIFMVFFTARFKSLLYIINRKRI